MAILIDEQNKIFYLHTNNTSYIFCVTDFDALEHLYYGKRVAEDDVRYISNRQIYSFHAHESRDSRRFSMGTVGLEIAPFHSGDFRLPSVVYNSEGLVDRCRLRYRSHKIYQGRKPIDGLPYSRESVDTETIEVVLTDDDGVVEFTLFYVVYADVDIIARYQTIKNNGAAPISIQKFSSMCLDFYGMEFDAVTLEGMYAIERAHLSRAPLKRGTFKNTSLTGISSHNHNPFIALCSHNADENLGEVYGFNLLYSSNFAETVTVSNLGDTRLIIGIDETGFNWILKQGESFVSPEAILTYSDQGLGGMSRNFHDHIRQNIIEREFAFSSRPIVINSWEPFGVSVTEEKMLSLASEAMKCGVDTVVLDDGWFRTGENVDMGIGDWYTVKDKFPSGLKGLSEKIHAMGLKFGIWFEPEMIGAVSELYKAHPDYVLSNSKTPLISRYQYVLDLTRDEVVETIADRICEELAGVELDYLKWDFNRYVTEAASSVTSQNEVYHRQMLGAYKLLSSIKKRLGNVFFETCSGGGGRFDLGMLFYSPQIWASDSTYPYGRIYIQYGTSYAYPLSAISCHFSEGRSNITGHRSTYEFRYNVAEFGSYGYELDLSKHSDEDKAIFKEYSARYRKSEDLTLQGDLYRLISPETDRFCAYMKVSKDKKKAQLNFLEIKPTGFIESMVLRLKGLSPEKAYKNENTGEVLYGSTLMNVGIRLGDLYRKKATDGYVVTFTEV